MDSTKLREIWEVSEPQTWIIHQRHPRRRGIRQIEFEGKSNPPQLSRHAHKSLTQSAPKSVMIAHSSSTESKRHSTTEAL